MEYALNLHDAHADEIPHRKTLRLLGLRLLRESRDASRVWRRDELDKVSAQLSSLEKTWDEGRNLEGVLDYTSVARLFLQLLVKDHLHRSPGGSLEYIEKTWEPLLRFTAFAAEGVRFFSASKTGNDREQLMKLFYGAMSNMVKSTLVAVGDLYDAGAPLHKPCTFIGDMTALILQPFVDWATHTDRRTNLPADVLDGWDRPNLDFVKIIAKALVALLDAAPAMSIAARIFPLEQFVQPEQFGGDDYYVVLNLLDGVLDVTVRAVVRWEHRLKPGETLPPVLQRGLLTLAARYYEASEIESRPISLTQSRHLDTFARIVCSSASQGTFASSAKLLLSLEDALTRDAGSQACLQILGPQLPALAAFLVATLTEVETQELSHDSDEFAGCRRLMCLLMSDAFFDHEEMQAVVRCPVVFRALFTTGFMTADRWSSERIAHVFFDFMWSQRECMGRCIANGELTWSNTFQTLSPSESMQQVFAIRAFVYAACSIPALHAADAEWPHTMARAIRESLETLLQSESESPEDGRLVSAADLLGILPIMTEYTNWPRDVTDWPLIDILQRRLHIFAHKQRNGLDADSEQRVITQLTTVLVSLLLSRPESILACSPPIEFLTAVELDESDECPLWGHVEYLRQLAMDAMLRSGKHPERLKLAVAATWKRLRLPLHSDTCAEDVEFGWLARSLLCDRLNDYKQIVPLPVHAQRVFVSTRRAAADFMRTDDDMENPKESVSRDNEVVEAVVARLDELKLGLGASKSMRQNSA